MEPGPLGQTNCEVEAFERECAFWISSFTRWENWLVSDPIAQPATHMKTPAAGYE